MSLKLIGAGFGRTGTLSTFAALNRLGFPCYHMKEVLLNKANKKHLSFWSKVAKTPTGTQHDWQKVFGAYTATVDFPACSVWRELLVAYPDAKVLLTLHPRGAEAWYDSVVDTIYFTETLWQFKVLDVLTMFGERLGIVARGLLWGRALKGVMHDKAKAVARYNTYVDEVKAAVPADKLLIFTVTDGWAPLCAFLGVGVPSEAFPNLNDRASIKKSIAGVVVGCYMALGVSFAVIVGLAGGIWAVAF